MATLRDMATKRRQRGPLRSITVQECPPPEGATAGIWFRVESVDDSGLFREVRIGLERREGAWTCCGLLVLTDGDLTARQLSSLGFGFIRDHAEWSAGKLTKSEPPHTTDVRRRGPKGKGDAFYRELAELYRYACDHPAKGYARRPVQWMHETHYPDYAIATIRTWLHRAKNRGYLDRRQGSAGYIPAGNEKEDSL
ncbi:MAG: hypothetical protein GX537_06690 [Actinobacteria bacterium]|nr:hypothetical protein [Actinomycetota bacterium]